MNRKLILRTLALPLGTAFGLLSTGAAADELFVASPTTVILEGNPYSGSFNLIGACGGVAHSMTLNGTQLLIGDPDGRIYRKSPTDPFVSYAFDVPNDAQALAMHDGDLLAGGSDATVVRVDPATGAVIATFNVSFPVSAMIVSGDDLYIGSPLGVAHKVSAIDGSSQFFGVCGGPVESLALDATHLILGSSSGHVYRIDLLTQLVDSSFAVASDAAAMVLQGGDLLIGGSDASLVRVDRFTGAVKGAIGATVPVGALAVRVEADPSAPYCYGIACPCGNDDAAAGCANTTGFGARLAASGTASVAADDLVIHAFQIPANRTSRFYMSTIASQSPLGDGFLCAGAGGYPFFRFPVANSGPAGAIATPAKLVEFCEANFAPTGHILAGATWHFQVWYRDPNGPCGTNFNTTNSASVVFGP